MRVRVVGFTIAAVLGAVVVRSQAQKAAPTTDVKNILYHFANNIGMLRGPEERDSITTLDFWATGTRTLNGQTCQLKEYRASFNYSVPGVRIDSTCVGTDGKPDHRIEVVSGKFAWNEAKRGVDATPAMETLNDRLIQLWSSPQAVVKAAVAGGTSTKVAVENGATVLMFPVPGVGGATIKTRLSPQFQAERVEARLADAVTEWTYSDYGELNPADYKADIFLPRRMTQKRGGVTVLDLTISKSNTYNPYVIMPVPDTFKAAASR